MSDPTTAPDDARTVVNAVKAQPTTPGRAQRSRDVLWRVAIVLCALVILLIVEQVVSSLYSNHLVNRNHQSGLRGQAQVCQFYSAIGVKQPATCGAVKSLEDPTVQAGNDAAAQRSKALTSAVCQVLVNQKAADPNVALPAVCGGP